MANYSRKFAALPCCSPPPPPPPQPVTSAILFLLWLRRPINSKRFHQRMRSAWATTPLMSFLCNIRLPTSQCTPVVDRPQRAEQAGRSDSLRSCDSVGLEAEISAHETQTEIWRTWSHHIHLLARVFRKHEQAMCLDGYKEIGIVKNILTH